MSKKEFVALAVIVLIVSALGAYLGNSVVANFGAAGYGPTHWQQENFLQGLYAGTAGQFKISNAGAITTSGAITSSGAVTQSGAATFSSTVALDGEVTLGTCGSASWNPGSVASSSVDGFNTTSTDIAVTGAAMGDVCIASLSSATSTAAVFFCNISSAATGTITLGNTGSDALDVATGTAKICYFD